MIVSLRGLSFIVGLEAGFGLEINTMSYSGSLLGFACWGDGEWVLHDACFETFISCSTSAETLCIDLAIKVEFVYEVAKISSFFDLEV